MSAEYELIIVFSDDDCGPDTLFDAVAELTHNELCMTDHVIALRPSPEDGGES